MKQPKRLSAKQSAINVRSYQRYHSLDEKTPTPEQIAESLKQFQPGTIDPSLGTTSGSTPEAIWMHRIVAWWARVIWYPFGLLIQGALLAVAAAILVIGVGIAAVLFWVTIATAYPIINNIASSWHLTTAPS